MAVLEELRCYSCLAKRDYNCEIKVRLKSERIEDANLGIINLVA